MATFGKLAHLMPQSPMPQLRLADAHTAAKNPAAAAAAVRRAQEIAPDAPQVQQAALLLALSEGKTEQALALARKVQAQRPDDAAGFVAEGDLALRARQYDNAIAAYRKAMAKKQPGEAAQRLHLALNAAGKKAEADKLATEWRAAHPDDLGFVLHLGDAAMAGNDLPKAEQFYRAVIDKQPNQAVAINNLAYALAAQKKPGGVAMAERALKLVPEAPAMLDTLAFALAAEGQLPKALEVQTRVVGLAPDTHNFRLQLARLLLQKGDKLAARLELDKLARLGAAFPRQAEVAELLKQAGT